MPDGIDARTKAAELSAARKGRGSERAALPGLTGLRFFAAAFVLMGHLLLHIDSTLPTAGGPFPYLINLAAIGMSLFFVLSGFVIHYNYSQPVGHGGWRGIANFFAARFARLYPLYFVVLMVSLLSIGVIEKAQVGDPVAIASLTEVFPYYLSLTFSWLYKPFLSNSLIYQYPSAPAMPVAWSISTEWFFYLAYPLLCTPLLLIRRPGRAIALIVGFAIVALLALHFVFENLSAIDDFAVSAFGTVASARFNYQDSFLRWLVYFSPISRILEFILGCLTAALFLAVRDRPLHRHERRYAATVQVLVVVALLVQLYLAFLPSQPLPFLLFLHMNFGFAPLVAILIFSVARYDETPVTRFLSLPLILIAGEASYSLYLLHPVVLENIRGPLVEHHGLWRIAANLLTGVGAFFAAIGVAIVSFTLFEAPARRLLRRLLTVAPAGGGRMRPRGLVVVGWGLVAAVFLVAPVGAGLIADSVVARSGKVRVIFATYGGNCGAHLNNALNHVRQFCTGRDRCSYTVSFKNLGDPAGGCAKDFSVEWLCGTTDGPYSQKVRAEAGFGSVVELSCPAAARDRITAAQ